MNSLLKWETSYTAIVEYVKFTGFNIATNRTTTDTQTVTKFVFRWHF